MTLVMPNINHLLGKVAAIVAVRRGTQVTIHIQIQTGKTKGESHA